jgi:hypothetical protein
MPAFRIAAGVLELMGGGGGILSGLQSIASGMSSFIKNSQFQFGSQIFGFFASAAASSGGGAVGGTSSGDGATADAGSSGGGVDSGGVDSGGGPINLGTGGFTYLEKTSTGDYEVNTFRPYEPYDGATTFTLVREAGSASSPFDRIPDYYTLSLNFGRWYGGTVQFSLSRSGKLFFGAGGNLGKSLTILSGSFTKGWLNLTRDPEPAEVDSRLSGYSTNAAAGFLRFGGGVTATPGVYPNAVERGFYSPQIGISGTYSSEWSDTGIRW